MEKQHTPGPWKVIRRGNQTGQTAVFIVGGGSNEPVVGKPENANLIAAAPEMLDVLIKVSKRLEMDFVQDDPTGWGEIYRPLFESVNNAIRKATLS